MKSMLRPNQSLISFLLQKTVSPKVMEPQNKLQKINHLCENCHKRTRMTRNQVEHEPTNGHEQSPLTGNKSTSQKDRSVKAAEDSNRSNELFIQEVRELSHAASSAVQANRTKKDVSEEHSISRVLRSISCSCRREVDTISSFHKLGISSFDNTASGNKNIMLPIKDVGTASFSKTYLTSKKKPACPDLPAESEVFLTDFIDIRLQIPGIDEPTGSLASAHNGRNLGSPQTDFIKVDKPPELKTPIGRHIKVFQRSVTESQEDRTPRSPTDGLKELQRHQESDSSRITDPTQNGVMGSLVDSGELNPLENSISDSDALTNPPITPNCMVCRCSTRTFVKHTLCCEQSLCYRCWDKFYQPHLNTFKKCPYC